MTITNLPTARRSVVIVVIVARTSSAAVTVSSRRWITMIPFWHPWKVIYIM